MRGDQRVKTAIARTPSCLRTGRVSDIVAPNRFGQVFGITRVEMPRPGSASAASPCAGDRRSGAAERGGGLVSDLFGWRRQREIDLEDGSMARV